VAPRRPPNTKLFFAETIGNPKINVLDIRTVADVAHDAGLPSSSTTRSRRPTSSARSSTAPTSSCTRPRSSSAATAPPSAASSSTAAPSRGRSTSTVPRSHRARPSYHGASYTAAVGDGLAYIIKARVQLLRDLGAAIAPQSAWNLIQGIETLSLRIERHVQNAQEIAEWLENHDDVASVNYSGPADLALVRGREPLRPEGRRRGAVVRAEGRRRGRPRVRQRARAVQPPREHRRRALARHPPGIHDALAADPRAAAHDGRHARPRAPVGGLENVEDLKADLEQALAAARKVSEAARA
jgi:O-acetylhomoserine (thiol)-lyase